jgi:hypothetical protein
MANYRFQFTIPYFTNMPSDVITNDWCFTWVIGTPDESDFVNAKNDLDIFYTEIYNIGATDIMAPWVVPANCGLKVYNIGDPPPRAPVYESIVPITATQATSSYMPLEVAICLSFQGDQVSGQPQARRRGRVFLGGWGLAADPGDADQFPRVEPIIRAGIADAAETLATNLVGHSWVWSVYSRVNASAVPVTNGWIDNEFDTQRRRGVASTARTTWP